MNKSILSKLFLVILIFTLGFFSGSRYTKGKYKATPQNIEQVKQSPTAQAKKLSLDDSDTVVHNVSRDEQTQIENLIAQFERYVYNRNADKLIALFTPPENKQEQSDLDFIQGKDLPGPPLSRLFSTAGFNLNTSAYYIRKIDKSIDTITAFIDEFRVLYSNSIEGGAKIGYSAQVSNLTAEFKRTDQGYQLSRYYHQKPNTGISKYEGFYAY